MLIAYKKFKISLEGMASTDLEAAKQYLMEFTRRLGWQKFDQWILQQLRSAKGNKWGLAYGISAEFEPFSRVLDLFEANFEVRTLRPS